MSPLRKTLVATAATVAVLLVVLAALPFLFRDRIVAQVKAAAAESVNARLAWSGIALSVLRDFPNVTLRVAGLTVAGNAPFARDTLVHVRDLRLVLDAGSVIGYLRSGRPIVIREVRIDRPVARLRVLADGRANWDIMRPSPKAGGDSARALALTLRALRITGGAIALDNAQSRLSATLAGIVVTLRGDFATERFVMATTARVDTASVTFAGLPWLSRAALAATADVDADLAKGRFTFRDDTLRVNRLALAFGGTVSMDSPDVAMDVTFATPSSAFADILSLVPAIYGRDFQSLRTAGTMSLNGRVRGAYGPAAFPSLALRAQVAGGSFRYPSLPLTARDIAMDLSVDNPGGHVDSTVVTLRRLHAVIGSRAVDARLVLRTPVSDPDVDLRALGSVDLADVARTVKLSGIRELRGLVGADVAMRARLSDVEARRYERVSASGRISASRVALRADSLPHAIAIDTAALSLSPSAATVSALAARVGSSDVRVTGALENLLGFALGTGDLRGRATLTSNLIALDELRSKEKTTTVIPVPGRVDMTLEANVARATFGPIVATGVRGGLRVKDERITLDDLQMETMRGTVVASGHYETTTPARPTFDMNLRVQALDIPAAFIALNTVQRLAPIARYAQGTVSGAATLRGPLGTDMSPVLAALTGTGNVDTDRLVVQGAPVLEKLADATRLEQLRRPALGAVRMAFAIADGRVHVKPFVLQAAGVQMTVAGSNGIDQSLAYDLALAAPRAELGAAASGAIGRLAAQAGRSLSDSATGAVVQLAAKVTGTVTSPSVRVNFAGMAASVRDAARSAVQQEVRARAAAVRQSADSAVERGRQRARAEADRLVAEAEAQGASMRAEARRIAAATVQAGEARADSLLARATNPAARIAARAATDRLKREAAEQGERIVREADARAEALVTQARERAAAVAPAASVP